MAAVRGMGATMARTAAASVLLACLCSCGYQTHRSSLTVATASPAADGGEARAMLGPAPPGVVLEWAGKLAPDAGVGAGASALPGGDYTLTAACTGEAEAVLTVTQPESGAPVASTSFPCGSPHTQQLRLATGSVSIRANLPVGSPAPTSATAAVRLVKSR